MTRETAIFAFQYLLWRAGYYDKKRTRNAKKRNDTLNNINYE